MRETIISVSRAEKDAIEDARLAMYNTDEVPYGAVIGELADQITNAEK